jgi:hypothetical protein
MLATDEERLNLGEGAASAFGLDSFQLPLWKHSHTGPYRQLNLQREKFENTQHQEGPDVLGAYPPTLFCPCVDQASDMSLSHSVASLVIL